MNKLGRMLLIGVSLASLIFLSSCACSANLEFESGSAAASGASAAASQSDSSAASSASSSAASSADLGNPRRQVAGLPELNALGLRMALPAEATANECYLIGETIAEADFVINDTRFVYRASRGDLPADAAGLAGINEEFSALSSIQATRDGAQSTLTLEVAPSGLLKASWNWPEGSYTLTASGSIPHQNFAEIALSTAQGG